MGNSGYVYCEGYNDSYFTANVIADSAPDSATHTVSYATSNLAAKFSSFRCTNLRQSAWIHGCGVDFGWIDKRCAVWGCVRKHDRFY